MNLTDVFVDTLYALKEDEIPESARFMARKCLLEETGLIYAGAALQKEKLGKYLDNFSGSDAEVFGLGRRASLQNAAFCNGISGHSFDFDDGHRYSTVHLASTVIPAVLAVAEKRGLSMQDVLRGIVIGYETAIRLGRCIQPSHRARGFHSSGTVGAVGAAMGVAAALDFDRDTMKSALAASLSSAAGINEMMENVSTMKPFNVGRACHDGITAALIAEAGFGGPYDPMYGNFGYLRGACDEFNEKWLSLDDYPGYHIEGGYHKPYACCRHTHGAVYSACRAVQESGAALEKIESIEIQMYGQGVKGHTHTAVPGVVAAKMSTPYCIGLALVKGSIGIDSFTDEALHDDLILSLSEKVHIEPDDEMTKWVPDKRAARAIVTLADGSTFTYQADYAPGEPELPMTTEDFIEKFTNLVLASGWTREKAAAVAEFILQSGGNAGELIALLRV